MQQAQLIAGLPRPQYHMMESLQQPGGPASSGVSNHMPEQHASYYGQRDAAARPQHVEQTRSASFGHPVASTAGQPSASVYHRGSQGNTVPRPGSNENFAIQTYGRQQMHGSNETRQHPPNLTIDTSMAQTQNQPQSHYSTQPQSASFSQYSTPISETSAASQSPNTMRAVPAVPAAHPPHAAGVIRPSHHYAAYDQVPKGPHVPHSQQAPFQLHPFHRNLPQQSQSQAGPTYASTDPRHPRLDANVAPNAYYPLTPYPPSLPVRSQANDGSTAGSFGPPRPTVPEGLLQTSNSALQVMRPQVTYNPYPSGNAINNRNITTSSEIRPGGSQTWPPVSSDPTYRNIAAGNHEHHHVRQRAPSREGSTSRPTSSCSRASNQQVPSQGSSSRPASSSVRVPLPRAGQSTGWQPLPPLALAPASGNSSAPPQVSSTPSGSSSAEPIEVDSTTPTTSSPPSTGQRQARPPPANPSTGPSPAGKKMFNPYTIHTCRTLKPVKQVLEDVWKTTCESVESEIRRIDTLYGHSVQMNEKLELTVKQLYEANTALSEELQASKAYGRQAWSVIRAMHAQNCLLKAEKEQWEKDRAELIMLPNMRGESGDKGAAPPTQGSVLAGYPPELVEALRQELFKDLEMRVATVLARTKVAYKVADRESLNPSEHARTPDSTSAAAQNPQSTLMGARLETPPASPVLSMGPPFPRPSSRSGVRTPLSPSDPRYAHLHTPVISTPLAASVTRPQSVQEMQGPEHERAKSIPERASTAPAQIEVEMDVPVPASILALASGSVMVPALAPTSASDSGPTAGLTSSPHHNRASTQPSESAPAPASASAASLDPTSESKPETETENMTVEVKRELVIDPDVMARILGGDGASPTRQSLFSGEVIDLTEMPDSPSIPRLELDEPEMNTSSSSEFPEVHADGRTDESTNEDQLAVRQERAREECEEADQRPVKRRRTSDGQEEGEGGGQPDDQKDADGDVPIKEERSETEPTSGASALPAASPSDGAVQTVKPDPGTPPAGGEAGSGQSRPPLARRLGLKHLDLVYYTSNAKMYCRLCLIRRKETNGKYRVKPLPVTASWPEMTGHCAEEHEASCEELVAMNNVQLQEARRQLKGTS